MNLFSYTTSTKVVISIFQHKVSNNLSFLCIYFSSLPIGKVNNCVIHVVFFILCLDVAKIIALSYW